MQQKRADDMVQRELRYAEEQAALELRKQKMKSVAKPAERSNAVSTGPTTPSVTPKTIENSANADTPPSNTTAPAVQPTSPLPTAAEEQPIDE